MDAERYFIGTNQNDDKPWMGLSAGALDRKLQVGEDLLPKGRVERWFCLGGKITLHTDARVILWRFVIKVGSVHNVVLAEVPTEFSATMTLNCGGEVVESNKRWWLDVNLREKGEVAVGAVHPETRERAGR